MAEPIKERSKRVVDALQIPSILFDYSIAWAETYADLFLGSFVTRSSPDGVLKVVEKNGRVLLCGRAGSGKSVIARLLAKRACDRDAMVAFINLSRWSSADAARISSASFESVAWMNLLLGKYSALNVTLLDLDVLSPAITKVVIVDGLNEIPASLVHNVLRALDDTVTQLIGAQVIVTDRLARREINEGRWQLGLVEPLSEASIGRALKAARRTRIGPGTHHRGELFEWPFFLATALDLGLSSASGSDVLHRFFHDHVHLSEDELARVAQAAYRSYEASSSRTFSKNAFAESVSLETFQKLAHAGAIEVSNDSAYFRHHLHHDFLAARYLAAHRAIWGYSSFNVLTFQASSFDAIALAFAQAPPGDKPAFVREVYDWNPYAIAFALSEEEYRRPDDLDGDTERVVLAMIAEKRWDSIIPTAVRARDALSLFPREKALSLLQIESLEDLFELVESWADGPVWFNDWKRTFCLRTVAALPAGMIDRLAEADSIIGWTLANVLKRLELGVLQIDQVVEFCAHQRPVVRWRSIHVLGAFPSERAAEIGFDLLDHDSDLWVRYGAIRSLVEMASKAAPPLRSMVLEGISARRTQVLENRRLRDELVRALRIRSDRTSNDWIAAAMQVILGYLDESATMEDLDYWGRAMRDLRSSYS